MSCPGTSESEVWHIRSIVLVEDVAGLVEHAFALLHATDHGCAFVGLGDLLRRIGGSDDVESHAHVQRLIDLLVGDVAEFLYLAEHRCGLEGIIDHVLQSFLHPQDVPESSAGDVHESVNFVFRQDVDI